jgi:hypothetical protein
MNLQKYDTMHEVTSITQSIVRIHHALGQRNLKQCTSELNKGLQGNVAIILQ